VDSRPRKTLTWKTERKKSSEITFENHESQNEEELAKQNLKTFGVVQNHWSMKHETTKIVTHEMNSMNEPRGRQAAMVSR
jgi:hypothetical protein